MSHKTTKSCKACIYNTKTYQTTLATKQAIRMILFMLMEPLISVEKKKKR
jgi:hypothetical protein